MQPMAPKKKTPQGITDQLRSAIERTFDATFGDGGFNRDKAQDLLDDAVSAAERFRKSAIDELKSAGDDIKSAASDEMKATRKRLDKLEKQINDLDKKLRSAAGRPTPKRKSAAKPAAKPAAAKSASRPAARTSSKPAAKKAAAKKKT